MGERGSVTIMHVRGLPIRLHATLLLILPYFAWIIARTSPALAGLAGIDADALLMPPLAFGVLLAVALFASVLFHELFHVFVGIRGGGTFRGVTLMLIGGVSEVETLPPRPAAEAAMAVAGPIGSLLLALACFAGFLVAPQEDLRFACFYLAQVNLVLALFNLLPAFPMDGGRILRAVLALFVSRVTATRVAAGIGQVVALLFLAASFATGNFMLGIIAVVVFFGARAELRMTREAAAFDGLTVGDAMLAAPPVVEAEEPLESAIERMRHELKTVLFVVSDGAFVGLLSAKAALEASRQNVFRVRDAVRRKVPALRPHQDLDTAVRLLRESGLGLLPVIVGDRLVGFLTPAAVTRLMQAREGLAVAEAERQPT